MHGVNIVYVDEAYTSKTCSYCGEMQDMNLSKRVYGCQCGMEIDRDVNSSINIYNKYKGHKELSYKKINQVITLYFQYGKLVA